ncbi:MAG: DUF2085 domain-containing protein [Gracilimonas sp.]|nr:DUF2085 domain-containing protein [Gracilimonas sp.]
MYFAVLVSTLFLVVASLGPGLFETSFSLKTWQHQVFEIICHQDAARSFDYNGAQMAVCSRCLGIYSLLFFGWLLLPLFGIFSSLLNIKEKNWLIIAIILNLMDVIGNYFGYWTNSLHSRLIMGGFLGLAIAVLLANEFFTINKSE